MYLIKLTRNPYPLSYIGRKSQKKVSCYSSINYILAFNLISVPFGKTSHMGFTVLPICRSSEGSLKFRENIKLVKVNINPFLFIRGLSCPVSVQTFVTENGLKLTIPGFPYNLCPVSCGDVGFKKCLGQVLASKSGL
jgi:hypothetical protein